MRAAVGRGMAVVAVLLALGAAAVLLLEPCAYRGEVGDASGARSTCASLVEVNGWGVAVVLAVPVLLTLVGAVLASTRRRRWAGITLGVLIGFCPLTGFTVGMFFLPACLALLVALLLTASRTGADLAPA